MSEAMLGVFAPYMIEYYYSAMLHLDYAALHLDATAVAVYFKKKEIS